MISAIAHIMREKHKEIPPPISVFEGLDPDPEDPEKLKNEREVGVGVGLSETVGADVGDDPGDPGGTVTPVTVFKLFRSHV
jgi:hypothetical protein